MTIMKPTRKEVIEHYKECDHCRHWFKFLKRELLKKQEVKKLKKKKVMQG